MDFEVDVDLDALLTACRDAAADSWGRIEIDRSGSDHVVAHYEGDNERVELELLGGSSGQSILRIEGQSAWENELRKMILRRVGAI